MKNLAIHIESLLLEHDCVIIPDFGGFIANKEQAKIYPDKGVFLPPARKIGFNVHLTYNDGLLAQELMKSGKQSYEAAVSVIKKEVEQTMAQLRDGQCVTVGKVGKLVLQGDVIIFEPDNLFMTDPQYYGLFPCNHFAKIDNTIPFSGFVKGAAAAIALFLLILPMNVLDKPVEEQASVLQSIYSLEYEMDQFEPIVLIDSLVTDSLLADDIPQMQQDTVTIEEPVAEIVVEKEPEVVPVKTTTKKQSVKVPLVMKSDDKFYVIIASLPNEETARTYLKEIKNYTFNDLCILKGKRRYLVSVKEFENKDEADLFVDDFRIEKPKFSKAWIATADNS